MGIGSFIVNRRFLITHYPNLAFRLEFACLKNALVSDVGKKQ